MWREKQALWRSQYLQRFDAAEARAYDARVGELSVEDEAAYRSDIGEAIELRAGMRVLDVGAGTGAFTRLLARTSALDLTALEPAPAMLERLRTRPELSAVRIVQGFCDSLEERESFPEASFDVIASRQTINSLYDPLAAFRNWQDWLAPGGVVVAIDGTYDRAAWTGTWEHDVDTLPLSATQSTGTVAYLLEAVGFHIERVSWMNAVNRRPMTRTPRYLVVARKYA
jgi:SAM-dependent methyltransferase